MYKWNNINDALPSHHEMKVVVIHNNKQYDTVWDAEHRCFLCGGGWFEIDEVTTWREGTMH